MIGLTLAALLAVSPAPQPPLPAAPVDAYVPPTAAAVMEIPPALRQLVHEQVDLPGGSQDERLQRLVALMFDADGLGLRYDHHATRSVAGIWQQREANCLSYTLLFVALARELGFDARVQEAGEVLAWYEEAGIVYNASHVNVSLRIGGQRKTVDFDRSIIAARGTPRLIGTERAMAHFHNNRGAELMAEGRFDAALASLQASLQADRGFSPAWNNLGVLLQRRGDVAAAEQAFLGALRLDADHVAALSNLVVLYRRQGNAALEQRHASRLANIQRKDPFQRFMLALECEHRGDYACAIEQYRQALRSNSREHLFRFGLARAYYLAGDLERARREMGKALAYADTVQVREAYQRKLDHLRGDARQGAVRQRPSTPPR